MKRLLLFACLFSFTAAFAADGDLMRAPVKKFRLPTFNEEGFRTSFLEGEEAVMVSSEEIQVSEMHFSLFSGTDPNELETTLLAPVATVHVKERNEIVVTGDKSVRLVRAEVDAKGEDWAYDHANKRLLIRKNVHVVFQAVLKDLIR